jgi:hypothetical protein
MTATLEDHSQWVRELIRIRARRTRPIYPEWARCARLPGRVSLQHRVTEIYDQGCTQTARAHCLCQALLILQCPKPSRLWVSWIEKHVEPGPQDVFALETLGTCGEDTWPWLERDFTESQSAPLYCPVEAMASRVLKVFDLPQSNPDELLYSIKYSLAAGWPVLAPIEVYPSFRVGEEGQNVPVPENDERVSGGHWILLVGYDDLSRTFCFVNSWSIRWGVMGLGFLPFDYVCDRGLTRQVWCLTARDPTHQPAAADEATTGPKCVML